MPPISCTSKWRWPSVRLAGLAHGGERRHQDVVERLAVGELLLELVGARAQRLVGERFQLLLQRVDLVDARPIGLDAPLVGGAEQLAGDAADHREILLEFRGDALRAAAPDAASRDRRKSGLRGEQCGTNGALQDAGACEVVPRHRRGSIPCQSHGGSSRARSSRVSASSSAIAKRRRFASVRRRIRRSRMTPHRRIFHG